MSRDPILTFTPEGIYCPEGGFHIDPWRPVARALITHGHSDHARPGHGAYFCTDLAAPVIRHRLGDVILETIRYSEIRQIGGVEVSFHPAGHVPGSAQIRVARAGDIWVVSGDYKLEDDGLSTPFEPVRCTHFVTESTFGLPVFNWRPQAEIAEEINGWWRDCVETGQTPMLGAYALGKAQRLLRMLDPSIGPILTHSAVENVNAVMRGQGISLPETIPVTAETKGADHPNALVLATPAGFGASWPRRFGKVSTGFASGWMQLRGVRRRRSSDRGFVISDHADWNGLLRAIRETQAENIYVTHGYTDIFTRYLNENGWAAQVVSTEFGGEQLDAEDVA